MLSYETQPGKLPPTPPNEDHLPISTSKSNIMTSTPTTNDGQPDTANHHIWLITGPAGCGKSTVAEFVAKSMNLPYIEGDAVSFRLSTFPELWLQL